MDLTVVVREQQQLIATAYTQQVQYSQEQARLRSAREALAVQLTRSETQRNQLQEQVEQLQQQLHQAPWVASPCYNPLEPTLENGQSYHPSKED